MPVLDEHRFDHRGPVEVAHDDHGWEPDDWTAGRLAVAAERQPNDEQSNPEQAGAEEMADEADEPEPGE